MIKNKKGFTLVELLAVIVLLSLIALIAIPKVLNVVEKSKKSSAIDSTYGFVDAINYQNQMADISDRYEKIEDGEYAIVDIIDKVNFKGKSSIIWNSSNNKWTSIISIFKYEWISSYL